MTVELLPGNIFHTSFLFTCFHDDPGGASTTVVNVQMSGKITLHVGLFSQILQQHTDLLLAEVRQDPEIDVRDATRFFVVIRHERVLDRPAPLSCTLRTQKTPVKNRIINRASIGRMSCFQQGTDPLPEIE